MEGEWTQTQGGEGQRARCKTCTGAGGQGSISKRRGPRGLLDGLVLCLALYVNVYETLTGLETLMEE